MTTFNKELDKELNGLAVAFAEGDQIAGERYMEKIQPLLKRYAKRQYTKMELEDLEQEFMIVAVEKAFDFAERYNNGTNNVLGLVYKACRNRLIDINKSLGAEKRSLYQDREVSLQSVVGEDGDMTMSEKVGGDEKTPEEQVMARVEENVMSQVVEKFAELTRGRNGAIVKLVYESLRNDWDSELLNNEIAEVLVKDTGVEPNNAAVRQAKSRALKAFRKSIEAGKLVIA